jgi:Xaa-Pro aminopeptidase
MRTSIVWLLLAMFEIQLCHASRPKISELAERRHAASVAFRDGIFLVHATDEISITADGFRQNPFFYYYTGFENMPGAIFALYGKSGESWLFLPSKVPFLTGMPPEVSPGTTGEASNGIQHVLDWSQLEGFLAAHAETAKPLYYIADPFAVGGLPPQMQPVTQNGPIPAWVIAIAQKWPNLNPKDVYDRVHYLAAIESSDEISASRGAARATAKAFFAGLRAIRPGASQRDVENAVESACWNGGAHGSSFWPWAMTGKNAVFPRPFWSMGRYDHLDATLRTGDMVRFDIGCESEHYGGDLGRTVPVSGTYSPEQREIWDALVAAYRAASKTFREGTNESEVFLAWRDELLRQRSSAKNELAKRAIDLWTDRKNDPFWQMHTMNLDAGFIEGPLRAGMVIDFEPIVSIGDVGFYLEDMFLITKAGAEDLTPNIPFTSDEIEATMKRIGSNQPRVNRTNAPAVFPCRPKPDTGWIVGHSEVTSSNAPKKTLGCSYL